MSSKSEPSVLVAATGSKLIQDDDKRSRYTGQMTTAWNHGAVPNGGYSLASALHCAQDAIQRKRGAQQANLFHSSTTYFNKVTASVPWTVEVRFLKNGRATTNVEVDLLQNSGKNGEEVVCLRVSAIFANFDGIRSDQRITEAFHILPDDPQYGARCPLVVDPNDTTDLRRAYKPHATPLHQTDAEAERKAKEAGQLVAAKYVYFPQQHVDPKDIPRHNITAIAFFADMSAEPFKMTPENSRKSINLLREMWFPTMTLSIEMLLPLPTTLALQRVGSIAKTTHLTHGQWRFEVELWSHPNDAEHFGLPKDGPQSVRLAYAQQTALSYSMAINKKSKM